MNDTPDSTETTGTAGTEGAALPWPGDELALRSSGGYDRQHFYESGRMSLGDIETSLAVVGRKLDSYSRVLEFGCGCGRILLWTRELADTGVSVHGVDIDERAVRWVAQNLPWVEAAVNQPLPPLEYPDGHFDLVFNHSVFTHLDESHQDQWLSELRRVIRPGGHVLLSVHGEAVLSVYEAGAVEGGTDRSWIREALGRDGIVFLEDDSFVGGPFPSSYHSTFHAPWYVFEHWARFFEVKAYLPQRSLGFQDFVLLERPPDDATRRAPPPIRVVRTAVETQAPDNQAPDNQAPDNQAPGNQAPDNQAPDPPLTGVIAHARNLLWRGADIGSPTRFGRLGVAFRRQVNRVLRHHDEHQREVTDAVIESVRDLEARVHAANLAADARLSDLTARLREGLLRMGGRVNRLEADLTEELRAVGELRRRVDEESAEGPGAG